MGRKRGTWLEEFAKDAEASDQLVTHGDEHVSLLAIGLLGEAGSVLAEVKKGRREGASYSVLKERLREEVGDCLWYFVRLVSVLDKGLLSELTAQRGLKSDHDLRNEL